MKCPACGKSGGHTPTGNLLRCKRCRGLMDPRPDGTAYSDPTKRLREQEGRHHERLAKRAALKGGI